MAEVTEAALLDAAVNLLAERGVNGVKPLTEVDQAAGAPKGSTAKCFPNVEDFYQAIWSYLVTAEMDALSRASFPPPRNVPQLAERQTAYVAQALAGGARLVKARVAIVLSSMETGELMKATKALVRAAYPQADDDAAVRVATLHRALTAVAFTTGKELDERLMATLFERAITGPTGDGWAFSPKTE